MNKSTSAVKPGPDTHRIIAAIDGRRTFRLVPWRGIMLLVLLLKAIAPSLRAEIIPLRFDRGAIWIDVNSPEVGCPLHFLLDTGAQWTVLGNDATTQSLQVKTPSSFANCGLGSARASVVFNLHASCGTMPLGTSAVCTDLHGVNMRSGHRVDGLLGADFLQGRSIIIDVAMRRLVLADSASADPAPAAGLPFKTYDGRIWVQVSSPNSARPLFFLLDTGCTRTTLDSATARRMGLSGQKSAPVGVVGGTMESQQASVTASLGGIRLPSNLLVMDLARENPTACRHINGLIGMDFIKEHRIGINFGSHLLAIGVGGAKPGALAQDRIAIRLRKAHGIAMR